MTATEPNLRNMVEEAAASTDPGPRDAARLAQASDIVCQHAHQHLTDMNAHQAELLLAQKALQCRLSQVASAIKTDQDREAETFNRMAVDGVREFASAVVDTYLNRQELEGIGRAIAFNVGQLQEVNRDITIAEYCVQLATAKRLDAIKTFWQTKLARELEGAASLNGDITVDTSRGHMGLIARESDRVWKQHHDALAGFTREDRAALEALYSKLRDEVENVHQVN